MLLVENLSFAHQHRTLFSKINFQLNNGELLHISGRNGSGKTTLLSLLAGLRKPRSGSILFHDQNMSILDAQNVIAYLAAEHNGLYLQMSARDNLKFWSEFKGEKDSSKLIDAILNHWGLGSTYLDKIPVARFSTGMKRRLGLARIELLRKPFILLDEPFNGLDTEGIQILLKMLEKSLQKGGSLVLVSHEIKIFESLITKKIALS